MARPAMGDASVAVDGDGLRLDLATGARVRLAPRDGDVFTAALVPEGRFKPVVEMIGRLPVAFAQFLVDRSGAPGTLRLTFAVAPARLRCGLRRRRRLYSATWTANPAPAVMAFGFSRCTGSATTSSLSTPGAAVRP